MSFDDLIDKNKNVGPKLVKCAFTKVCPINTCLHKFPHYPKDFGRPEQPDELTFIENWDCTKMPCSESAICV